MKTDNLRQMNLSFALPVAVETVFNLIFLLFSLNTRLGSLILFFILKKKKKKKKKKEEKASRNRQKLHFKLANFAHFRFRMYMHYLVTISGTSGPP